MLNLRDRVIIAYLVGQDGIDWFACIKLEVRSRLRPNYWLVDWWDLRLLGYRLVRLLLFLLRQLFDSLLEYLVDLGKDIFRYFL